MSLKEIEKVSIGILMDNSTDFLLTNSAHAIRPPLIVNEKFNLPPPIAEHGFSVLVNIVKDSKNKAEKNSSSLYNNSKSNHSNKTFLFDTGVSENGVVHNADVLGIEAL
jgi:7,8-dihydropterin-6-yl-methyl-4-(beta-D-ribofuranosyl)aminobenzene 5'-phosphate synthase